MLIRITAVIGQRKTLKNCTRNLYLVKKVTVWYALSLVGFYFFEDEGGQTVKINSERYVAMLQNFFIPYLEENECDTLRVWFQQDEATAHTVRVSMNVIRETFAGRLISRNGHIPWPLCSLDLNPWGFFFRGGPEV